MDGNGRWAKNRGLKRKDGHKKGTTTVKEITTHCASLDIKYITLYAFSTENWKRPKLEVSYLIDMLNRWLKKELDTLMKNSIKFNYIGDITKFPQSVIDTITKTVETTKNNSGLVQTLALNYGSKDEIIRAVNNIDTEISSVDFQKKLDTKDMPDVDMLIRTGGEKRLSNFMLWQSAYAEIFFIDTLWPDFTPDMLDDIISQHHKRERKFGGL
jgi:undecaprenyl diphosphate synthase